MTYNIKAYDFMRALFEKIEHGDPDHRKWLWATLLESTETLEHLLEDVYESGRGGDRRAIQRPLCKKPGCDLPEDHAGKCRGPCGCLNGCKAWGCPNV